MAPMWSDYCRCCDRSADKRTKRRIENNAHLYCGCSQSRKQRKMMAQKSAGTDKQTLIDSDVEEAADYDFTSAPKYEEWLVDNPEVPFLRILHQVFQPHSDIVIDGLCLPNALRFSLNLYIGNHETSDIAFHFNPRFDQKYCARNCRFQSKWGPEEGQNNMGFPFQRGQPFHLEVFFTHTEFLVAVNGLHYCAFTYRAPLYNVTRLEIKGDISMTRIQAKTVNQYPNDVELVDNSATQIVLSQQIVMMSMLRGEPCVTEHPTKRTPFIGCFAEKLQTGSEIEICGRVKLLPFSFLINLQQGRNIWPHPSINLHISTRFNQESHGGYHIVLCNTWLDNEWGKEEFSPQDCLFTPGQEFSLRILCREDAFVAWVDEQPLFNFKHRNPFQNIDTLFIQGDIFINEVKVIL